MVEDADMSEDQDKNSMITLLKERISSLEKEKENIQHKLDVKETKIDQLRSDKETLLKDKANLLEVKNEILQSISSQELELQQRNQKYSELQLKFKQSSGELLSKSMQIDRLLKKVEEMELLKASEEEGKGEKISLENTGVLSCMEDIISYMGEILPQGKTNVRLVVPEIDDLEKHELMNILKELPSKVRINIAGKIDDTNENTVVQELKDCSQLTNYNDTKFIALNVDSANIIIGILRGDDVIGLYTDIIEFINLLLPTIMEPFIKGRKI